MWMTNKLIGGDGETRSHTGVHITGTLLVRLTGVDCTY